MRVLLGTTINYSFTKKDDYKPYSHIFYSDFDDIDDILDFIKKSYNTRLLILINPNEV